MKNNKRNKKGFTLAELLIVVAIIAVLVAISIPIFTSQLEKSKEATDAANLRAAYAEVMAAALTDEAPVGGSVKDGVYTSAPVEIKQTTAGWQSSSIKEIGGVKVEDITPNVGGSMVVTYSTGKDGADGTVAFSAE